VASSIRSSGEAAKKLRCPENAEVGKCGIGSRRGRRGKGDVGVGRVATADGCRDLACLFGCRGDRGFWLKLPRTSLARSSQLRRGRSGEPGGKG
jgi:hypothetical protein